MRKLISLANYRAAAYTEAFLEKGKIDRRIDEGANGHVLVPFAEEMIISGTLLDFYIPNP